MFVIVPTNALPPAQKDGSLLNAVSSKVISVPDRETPQMLQTSPTKYAPMKFFSENADDFSPERFVPAPWNCTRFAGCGVTSLLTSN